MSQHNFMTDQLEQVLGRELTAEEQDEIILWQKGKLLQQVVSFPGWDVVKEMLSDYVVKAGDVCISTDPGQVDEVRANQAVAFATKRVVESLLVDIQRAVEAPRPEIITHGARVAKSAVPLESM